MPSHIAEDNTVILPDGRFDAIVVATCRDARNAEFVAACYRNFANASDAAKTWLLDGGGIERLCKRFDKEVEAAERRIAEDEVADAAFVAASGQCSALAAE